MRIGTRPSRLALKQFEEIARSIPEVEFELIRIETEGDRDKATPLSAVGNGDFFTLQIEEALLAGVVDAAVHSAKDLEETPPEGLIIAALTRSISPYERLVSKNRNTLKELPAGSVVDTSSAKRKESLLVFRSDLVARDIRGDIDERLKQLDDGYYDAVIVAHAALIRLEYEDRITEILPPSVMKPHPLQGALTIQVRRGDEKAAALFRRLDVRKR
jgi:hydroxymethylbilane synthase